jgi:site-specific DNA recombinase
MGGQVPLGYRVRNRKLVIDKQEARRVRLIFERYLVLGSLPALQQELRQAGIVSRRRRLSSGAVVGGVPFGNGALAHLLCATACPRSGAAFSKAAHRVSRGHHTL